MRYSKFAVFYTLDLNLDTTFELLRVNTKVKLVLSKIKL